MNTLFYLLASVQLKNMTKMIAHVDQGHDLLDRIFFAIPLVFHLTMSKMAANNHLATKVVSDFQELYENIDEIENTEFTFDEEGRLLLREKMDYFVAEVNKAVRKGKVQVKDVCLIMQ